MSEPEIALSSEPVPGLRDLLGDGLNRYNDEAVGYTDRRPLEVSVKNPDTGELLGGIAGRTSLALLFIDLVYLAPALRHGGLGSRLLAMVEAEGVARGCTDGVLFTMSIQAPDFYKRHGWVEFGRIECQPPGTSRIWLRKRLG